jgi:hypothetical protein
MIDLDGEMKGPLRHQFILTHINTSSTQTI